MRLKTETRFKTYDDVIKIPTFEERLKYLMLHGKVAKETFGYDRYLNQVLYSCYEWKHIRNQVIIRDCANDLACEGYEIVSKAYIHHINPITIDDILQRNPIVFDMNNLITTSFNTHQIIHYGSDTDVNNLVLIERKPNDTSPWRK